MKIYFATLVEQFQSRALTRAGGWRRLVSFFDIISSDVKFREYVTTGRKHAPPRTKRLKGAPIE